MYAPKFNRDRAFVEKKSRIITKSYSQIQEVDFKKIYTATTYLESFCLLLNIIASLDLYLQQLYFVATYVNSDIDFDMYME